MSTTTSSSEPSIIGGNNGTFNDLTVSTINNISSNTLNYIKNVNSDIQQQINNLSSVGISGLNVVASTLPYNSIATANLNNSILTIGDCVSVSII